MAQYDVTILYIMYYRHVDTQTELPMSSWNLNIVVAICNYLRYTYLYLIRFCFPSRYSGNAVGYVRLLQSGSKNANYRSRSFMSRFNSKFVRSADISLDKSTEGAIREYEKSVEHLKECYSDCTNYFKVRQVALPM